MRHIFLLVVLFLPAMASAGRKIKHPASYYLPSCNGVLEDKADKLSNPPTAAQLNNYYVKYCSQAKYEVSKRDTRKLMKELISIINSGAYLNEISWEQNNALFYSNCCD